MCDSNNQGTIAKSLCTPSKLPASDYMINPYLGCTHGCRYCYARFMGRFHGHQHDPWGSYLVPRIYQSMRLPRNLKGKTILIGSVTDAYNPGEAHFHQMPPILEALRDCEAHVEILTKSSLVLRDVKLIKSVPDISVGVSLSNLCPYDNAALEPRAGTAAERLDALRLLHDAEVRTYLFVGPYLPGVTDLQRLAQETKGFVDQICVENLNLRGSYKADMLHLIAQLHPELTDLYRKVYADKGGGTSYWQTVEQEIQNLRASVDVPVVSYLYHERIKKGRKAKAESRPKEVTA